MTSHAVVLPQLVLNGEIPPSFCSFLFFFPCISVGKPATHTHYTFSIGVKLVGAISVLGDYESERCEVVDMESGREPLPHPTTTLAIYAVTSVISDHINLAHFRSVRV